VLTSYRKKTEEKKMRKVSVMFVTFCFSLALFAVGAQAQQDKSKRPSPPATATFDLGGGKSITVEYSSPRAKGRKIFGDVVPFGKVWRTGANEATTFVATANVTIGSLNVPAGSYTIFTIPNQDKWTLIINKKTGEWGIPYNWESLELGRTDMKVSSLSAPLENFTIAFDQTSAGCTLRMDWETTRASVEITAKK
jgi:hypothetical protein